MLRAADGGDFTIGLAGERIEAADVEGSGVLGSGAAPDGNVEDDALRLPRGEVTEFAAECGGIAGEFEGFERERGGRGVLAVGRGGRGEEAGDEDVGAERADDANDVGEDGVAVPNAEGFVDIFRETEIEGAGEELVAAVDPAGGEEFVGADETECGAELGSDEILAAVPAGERQIAGAIAAFAGEVGDKAGVFVVRVGGDVENRGGFAEGAKFVGDVAGGEAGRGAGGCSREDGRDRKQRGEGTAPPGAEGRKKRADHLATVKGAENWMFSQVILMAPPPVVGSFSMRIVSWSAG